MTTLPQTSPLRLPRPSNGAASLPATVGGAGVPGYPAAGAGAGFGGAGGFHMTGADVWRVIRTNLWLIALFIVLGGGIGFGLYKYLNKYHASYTATGFVQIQPLVAFDPAKNVQPEMNQQMLAIEQRTQAQYLTHDSLFSRVFSNPNKAIRETSWFKQFEKEKDPIAAAKEELRNELEVRPIPDSKLVAVSMSYKDGREAKTIVEDVVQEHLDYQRSVNMDKQAQRSQMLLGMRRRYERNLEDVMNRLRQNVSDLNIDKGGVPGRLVPKEEELRDLLQAQFEIQGKAREAKMQYESIVEAQRNGTDPPQVEEMISRDQDVQSFKAALNNTDLQLARLQHLGEGHNEVQRLKAERDIVQQKLDEARDAVRVNARAALEGEAKSIKEATEAQVKEIGDRIATANRELGDLTYKMSQYLTNKDEEEALRTQLKEINESLDAISQSEQQRDFNGVVWGQRPETPDRPSFPNPKIVIGGSLFAGLALALGIAFLREILDTSVRSPRDITRVGQLTLLGMIPHEDEDPQSAGVPLTNVIFQAPHSMMAEQFRQVRTRLQHAAALDATKSILVTSPGPQDGKTMVAVNLAAGLALNGRRILLVDANFRRPEIHKTFALPNDAGFSTVLSSLESFATTVQQTQVPNLDVLPSGPKPGNATELLESQLLIDFIERALEEYDHVIFDSGPMLVVSETVALAPRVDGVMTVVRARTNSRGLLQRMRDELRKLKAEHLGVVLNAVRAQAGGYYNRSMKTYYAYQNGHAE
jgi:capsular exopolysaccharide synthesis family protein